MSIRTFNRLLFRRYNHSDGGGYIRLAKQNMTCKQIEYGDIFFFFRPKVEATKEVKGIEDVQRFYMVTCPEEENGKKAKSIYRLFLLGAKQAHQRENRIIPRILLKNLVIGGG